MTEEIEQGEEVLKEVTEPTQANKRNVMPRYSVSLTPKNIEQVKAIQEEMGFASISETVRGCIQMMYTKTFPSYARGAVARVPDVGKPMTPTEIAEDRLSKSQQRRLDTQHRAEQKKSNEMNASIHICENELDGAVGADDAGNPATCAYFQYDGRRRFEQEIDLGSVTTDLTETQYLPNKDRVKQLQADGNVDYNPDEDIADTLNASV